MDTASITIDPAFEVGEVNPRLFGSFVEHMGRCVYGGIFQPGHETAGDDGLRGDVLGLTRELGVTLVRYPGGNFVSGYRWEDGIGPVHRRPRRLDLAWKSIETNRFGVDEFMAWTRAAGVEPMMAVNLGTRGVQEACDLLEYTNHPGGTALSDLRRSNGADEPYRIRLWCLGNEPDGPWQVGHRTATEYGRLAAETARAMRLVDPSISLVACGSSHREMPTFGAWEATVLSHCYDQVDHISLHQYYDPTDRSRADLFASAFAMDAHIRDVVATADHVAARTNRRRRLTLSFDEWNIWYQSRLASQVDGRGWAQAPALIEDTFTADDAVVVGDLLITLLRNADRVAMACQAQLVNVIAPIRTEEGGPAWRQGTFHPFALTSRHARGVVLRTEPVCPLHHTERYGPVPALGSVAVHDGEVLTLFAVNRAESDLELVVDLRAFPGAAAVRRGTSHTGLDGGPAVNTATRAHVVPCERPVPRVDGGRCTVALPATSWNMLRFPVPR